MDVQRTLKEFKARLDPKIATYFDTTIREMKEEDFLVAEAIDQVKKLTLAGGKRLRPAFMYYGYQAAGGADFEKILETTVAVELIHIFLLIHDDIIDRDELRHGVPTLHERYTHWGQQYLHLKDGAHFGNSIAIIVGDMLFALGNDIIFRSGFQHEKIFTALSAMQQVVSRTVVGQAKDIYMEYRGVAPEAEILKMYENKTARYTIEGPLHVGAHLAGGSPELMRVFSAFALPLGIAFQIQDDILGIFGDEDRTGKPVGSDIAEGKITLLVSRALEKASPTERQELERLLKLGTKLTFPDIGQFRDIIVKCGSLEYAKNLAARHIETGKQALMRSTVPMDTEAKDFFLSVADYLANREY